MIKLIHDRRVKSMGNIKYLSLIGEDNNLDLVEVLCTFYLEEYHSKYIIYTLNKNSINIYYVLSCKEK